MERLQLITEASCPEHGHRLLVVIKVTDKGEVDIWRGCRYCHDASRRLLEGTKDSIEEVSHPDPKSEV